MHSRLPDKEVVLLGIGHTNAHVLRMWRMRPIAGARLTCVSDFPVATYSGMLPGVLAGQYPPQRMEIDLVRLTASARARLLVAEVAGLDLDKRELLFAERPPLPFDVLSIGIGSEVKADGVDLDAAPVVPVKPMQTFLARLTRRLRSWVENASGTLRIVIVGGGAGGVEVAFCVPSFVRRILPGVPLSVALVHKGESLVAGSRAKTNRLAMRELERRDVVLHLRRAVTRVAADHVVLDGEENVAADVVIWATGAAAPPILSHLNLPSDDAGFLLTRPTQQTTADLPIFVVGDSGTRISSPTPKAGVYAVRQGPVLWENVQRLLDGRPLRRYEPQVNFLKLLNTGDGRAIAEYKGFSGIGQWAWKLKDWIDGRFMDKYQDYRPMAMAVGGDADDASAGDVDMKCAGCGCKVSAGVLSSVLARLDLPPSDRVAVGLARPDDAAVLRAIGAASTVVTTDFFTAPLEDAYLVGRIAALNAASDAFAMGAEPIAALAMVMLPEGERRRQEQLLLDLLWGAVAELRLMNAALVGGHTIEAPQVAIGFTVLAEPMGRDVITKAGLQPGDVIVLTKPLGTGVLLAANMRARCPAEAMSGLLESMLQSNETAARIAAEMRAGGMTDVTGFGLAGHLLEMLAASDVAAEIDLAAVPLLPGTADLISQSIESTLAPANRAVEAEIAAAAALRQSPGYAALFDPQTCGGLLVGVREEDAADFLRKLGERQGPSATVIGRVVPREPEREAIRLI